jgi:protocatechuate 4,5-dioxygenase beta chain
MYLRSTLNAKRQTSHHPKETQTMAKIIGAVTTSHVPAIGGAIAKGKQQDPYWKPFFDGFAPVRQWLASARPDVVVCFYNDHGLHFFLDT